MTAYDEKNPVLDVKVQNFPSRVRTRNTTIKTYLLDPANANFKWHQIASYEPNRCRMVVIPVDAAIGVTQEAPVISPDNAGAGTAPQGGYLPQSTNGQGVEFRGQDALWINSLTGNATRVTVIKEYE